MEKSNFEKLEVYQLAEKLADEIWEIVCKWQYFEKDTVGKQIVRSADSIDERPCVAVRRKGMRELGLILLKVADVIVTKTINVLLELPEVL